jgi:hypothetical protein
MGTGIMRGWIEIDGFREVVRPTQTVCPSAEAAIDLASAEYNVVEFMDYDAVAEKYRERYLRCGSG